MLIRTIALRTSSWKPASEETIGLISEGITHLRDRGVWGQRKAKKEPSFKKESTNRI